MPDKPKSRIKTVWIALVIGGFAGILLSGGFSPAEAKIYKYVDDQGKTHYTNTESAIPQKYRSSPKIKQFRGVVDPSFSKSKSQKADGGKTAGDEAASGDAKEAGLSKAEQGQVEQSIDVLTRMVKMSASYDSVQYNFTTGRRLINSLQTELPLKEKLSSDLRKTKVKELQEVQAFLQQSIARDRETKSVGLGLKMQLVAMFDRVRGEAKTAKSLIGTLEKALKESEKAKKAAQEEQKETGAAKK